MSERQMGNGQSVGSLLGGIFGVCSWFARLFYVNLLWIGFSLVGGVILGIFPATVALFTVTRREINGDYSESLVVLFLRTYKAQFWRANALGFSMIGIAIVLAADYLFFTGQPSKLFQSVRVLVLAGGMAFVLCSLYVFPACAHFGVINRSVVKKSIATVYRAPFTTALMLAACAVSGYIFWAVPALVLVMGVAIFALATIWPAERAFNRLWQQQAPGAGPLDRRP